MRSLSYLLLITIVASVPSSSSGQWTDIPDPNPMLAGTRGIHFFDEQTGVMCGVNKILRTTDGAGTWQLVASFLSTSAYDLKFTPDGIHGICGLGDGQVLVTHDAGVTWTNFSVGISADIWEVAIADAQHMFIDPLFGSEVYHTADGGQTWNLLPTLSYFQDMQFLTPSNGYACKLTQFMHTTDGGQTWTEVYDDFPEPLQSTCFLNEQEGWVCGDGGYIGHTTDGGVSWTEQYLDADITNLYCIEVNSSGLGIAGGAAINTDPPVLHTIDGGNTWHLNLFAGTSIWAVAAPPGQVGYTCQHNGNLWKLLGGIGMDELEPATLAVGPNPATERITIRSSGAPLRSIELLDASGRLLIAEPATGTDAVLDRQGLAAGTYLLRVQQGNGGQIIQTVLFE